MNVGSGDVRSVESPWSPYDYATSAISCLVRLGVVQGIRWPDQVSSRVIALVGQCDVPINVFVSVDGLLSSFDVFWGQGDPLWLPQFGYESAESGEHEKSEAKRADPSVLEGEEHTPDTVDIGIAESGNRAGHSPDEQLPEEGRAVVEQRVKEHAKGVNVGRGCCALARELLRRGIAGGAKGKVLASCDRRIAIARTVGEFGKGTVINSDDAEIGENITTVGRDKDVVWFDIPVDDRKRMKAIEGLAEVKSECDDLPRTHPFRERTQ